MPGVDGSGTAGAGSHDPADAGSAAGSGSSVSRNCSTPPAGPAKLRGGIPIWPIPAVVLVLIAFVDHLYGARVAAAVVAAVAVSLAALAVEDMHPRTAVTRLRNHGLVILAGVVVMTAMWWQWDQIGEGGATHRKPSETCGSGGRSSELSGTPVSSGVRAVGGKTSAPVGAATVDSARTAACLGRPTTSAATSTATRR